MKLLTASLVIGPLVLVGALPEPITKGGKARRCGLASGGDRTAPVAAAVVETPAAGRPSRRSATGQATAVMWPAVIALIAGSVIGLFYYLRVIVAICAPAPDGATAYAGAIPMVGGATLAALSLVLFAASESIQPRWSILSK